MSQLWKTVWSFLKKLKIKLLFDPEIPLLGVYPKIESKVLKRYLHTYIRNSTVHDSKAMEATCIHWWMNKENVVYLFNELLMTLKREGNLDRYYNMVKPWKLHDKWNKTTTHRQILNPTCIKVSKVDMFIETKLINIMVVTKEGREVIP